MTMHEALWIKAVDLLKEGSIPIDVFDTLTRKRIVRILDLREKQLEEKQKYMEEQAKQQERDAVRKTIRKK